MSESMPARVRITRSEKQIGSWSLVLLLWAVLTAWMAAKLPTHPMIMGDSADYLALASYRPPVYGWLVNAFRWITGSLEYLPLVQWSLFAPALLIFAIELGQLLGSPLVAAAAVILVLKHQDIYGVPGWLMSEGAFTPLIMMGLGLQFRYTRMSSIASLLGATICFAFATGTRTAGVAFLIVPLLSVLLDRRQSIASATIRAGQVAVMAGLVLAMVMAGNWVKNGYFEIGSWSGISLLGKGLLLIEPADVTDFPSPVAEVAPAAQDLRELIEQQPDLGATLRAQGQAYEDLRFALFYPAAAATWPAWSESDWRIRGKLALALSEQLIKRHPGQYLRLWARDWVALILYPGNWPSWVTKHADGALFPLCRIAGDCWALFGYAVPAGTLLIMLVVSLGSLAGCAVLLVARGWAVLRRRADPTTTLFWSLALVLQGTLLMSSAFEIGIGRYTIGTHLLGVALLLWFVSLLPIRVVNWFAFDRRRRLSGRIGWPSSLIRSGALLFSGCYITGIAVGVLVFWLCFSFDLLSSLHILFYRGLSLVIVALLVQFAGLGFGLWLVRRYCKGFPLSGGHVAPIVLSSVALNLSFFVLVPVNLDRSISVFLLAWMDDHHSIPQTKEDLQQVFLRIYIDADGAIDRRISEQLASGNIVASGNGYALTGRGSQFVSVAREIGLLFATDQRFLHPTDTKKLPESSALVAAQPSPAPLAKFGPDTSVLVTSVTAKSQ